MTKETPGLEIKSLFVIIGLPANIREDDSESPGSAIRRTNASPSLFASTAQRDPGTYIQRAGRKADVRSVNEALTSIS